MSDNFSLFRKYEIEDILRNYLQSQGIRVAAKKIHGAAIEGEDQSGKRYVFEVEGNQKRDGRPLDKSQKYVHFHKAFGQICSRLKDDSGIYALGLPFDSDYIEYERTVGLAMRKLGLHTYFVPRDRQLLITSCFDTWW